MTIEEAKEIIRTGNNNVLKRLEALAIAESVLGDSCTLEEINEWATKDE